jgi:ABC-2 type transport system ATP-binding protein
MGASVPPGAGASPAAGPPRAAGASPAAGVPPGAGAPCALGPPPAPGPPPATGARSASGPPPVAIEGLTKRLGNVLAVDRLDLVVERGQVLGLAGPNGAGKSVTLKILLGLIRPTAGRVTLFGEQVRPGASVLARVGALVDGPGFVPHLTGRQNLRLACRMAHQPDGAAGLDRAIEIAGLGEALDRPFKTYSHGMRYRLGLAQALLGAPELLLLDEPTTGLDPAHIREIRQAIAGAAAAGTTVVFSSHLLSEVQRVCTHAAVMSGGRLLACGAVGELMRGHDSLEDAYLDLVKSKAPANAANGQEPPPRAGGPA